MNTMVPEGEALLLSLDFPSSFEEVDRVCAEVQRVLKEKGLAGSIFGLQLLMREALNNAVVHGNKKDSRKRVICQVLGGEGPSVTIAVEDEGEGFDWRRQLENEMDEEAGSGRGLPIMKLYGRELRFNEKGNRVMITIEVQGGGAHDRDNQ
jgi:serine/threonine-protein kinase RsbW